MSHFTTDTPKQFVPDQWMIDARPASVAKTGSHAPETYAPIEDAPDVYTHIGHSAQYGNGRRNGRTIRAIALHTVQGDDFKGSFGYSTWRDGTVSTTAYAGSEGELGLVVPEEHRAWTSGRWNDETLSLEILGYAEWTAAKWRTRPRQIESIAVWIADISTRYDIPIDWLSADQLAQGASRRGDTPKQGDIRGVVDHLTCNDAARLLGQTSGLSHWDVGPGLREVLLNDILPRARELQGKTSGNALVKTPTIEVMQPHEPLRVLDTRGNTRADGSPIPTGGGRLLAGGVHQIGVAFGQFCSINVVVIDPSADGWLSVSSTRENSGQTSLVNFKRGEVVGNGNQFWCPDGHVYVQCSADADLVIDLFATGQ